MDYINIGSVFRHWCHVDIDYVANILEILVAPIFKVK
jgi:hypothetical protein